MLRSPTVSVQTAERPGGHRTSRRRSNVAKKVDWSPGPAFGNVTRSWRLRHSLQRFFWLLLVVDPGQNRLGMTDDGAVRKFDRRQLLRPGRVKELIARASTQERNWTAVCGDDLLIIDSCCSKRLLNATTRVEPRPTVVSVANVKSRLIRHRHPLKSWFPYSRSTTSFSPDSIFSQLDCECSASLALALLSWLNLTVVVPPSSSSSYRIVW
jgi:hypothetical protein